jgi:hypothetical protein
MIWILLFCAPVAIHLLAGAFGMIHKYLGTLVYCMGWSAILALLIGAWAFVLGLIWWIIVLAYDPEQYNKAD